MSPIARPSSYRPPASHIHHNVVVNAALHWRDNGLGAYQDNNAQVQMRSGHILVERNVFVGSAALLLSNFAGQEPGDATST